ncbi:MAG: DUF4382 domain-containing protein [Desulfobacteraceae bacterium]|nr:MAG: DUF4382 domain-containing protein [Desulfobacteraceae bacterium]
MKVLKLSFWTISFLFILTLAACSGGGSSSGGGTGTLDIALSDATIDGCQAVYVTIAEVQVHKDGGSWEVVASPEKTYSLLDLVNGVRERLGLSELEAGNYTQMRLILGHDSDDELNMLGEEHPFANYIIDESSDCHELEVPSGYQTGIKMVNGFYIYENERTELLLDFDVYSSIVEAGNSGKMLLKPTVKVINLDNYSDISGTVSAEVPLAGVLVSAQIYDDSIDPSFDEKDRVVVQASTRTDADGNYKIILPPGTYNIVAYKKGYDPNCYHSPDAYTNSSHTQNFTLNETVTGVVSGHVEIIGGSSTQHVTLSFRQIGQCEGNDIEVRSLNVAKGGDYDVTLPVGPHIIVASTDGGTTVVYEIFVIAGGLTQDITL